MIARKLRPLKPGTEYNRLIAPSLNGYLVRLDDADTNDTLKLIQEVIAKSLNQTEKLAPVLKGSSLMETCRNIWNWVYQHIQYKEDRKGHEEIRHPARSWSDRKTGVDCDDYAVMISSILTNLRIHHKLRMTDYGRGWQHIYVVVPKDGNAKAPLNQSTDRNAYITLDDVTDRFDHEVTYQKNRDIPMTLNELNGLDSTGLQPTRRVSRAAHQARKRQINGFGYYPQTPAPALGNIFKKIGKAVKSVAQGVKKAATTPVRLGILASMKLNFPKGADKYRFGYLPYGPIVAKAGYGPAAHASIVNSLKKLIKTFVGLGGDHKVLFTTIIQSVGNKDKAVPLNTPNPEVQDGFHGLGSLAGDPDWDALQQITNLNSRVVGVNGLNGGLGELGVVAETAIAAAAAVLVPILKMMSGAKANDDSDPVPDIYLPDDTSADDAPADDTDPATVQGLGAVAKKKAAAKRVTAVVARATKKGKTVAPKVAAVAKKAAKVAPKAKPKVVKAKVVNKAAVVQPLAPKATVSTEASDFSLPTNLPTDTDGNIPGVVKPVLTKKVVKAARKAAKKPGLLKKVATGIKNAVTKLTAKKKVKANAAKIKTARANGDHASADAMTAENAQIVKDAASDIHIDTTATSANTGVVRRAVPVPTDDSEPDSYVPDVVESTVQKAVNTATKINSVVRAGQNAVRIAQGKPALPVPTTTTDDGYDPHEVVDTKAVDDTAIAPTDGSTAQAGMGTVIGVGLGALLLGGLLFGGKSGVASGTSAAHRYARPRPALQGAPKRRKIPKKRRYTGLKGLARVPLQD